ncbi:MAG: site-2 protease family protein [Ruminococcaceae bacterium]|jgi:regulator of sigma E protease|nr:site-2 protease family protein [Oscillospiraceae bacterium]
MYILLAIISFGVLIFVHELGHFLAAKALGVKVNEFSVCMGPALLQKTVGETTYSLRCIPIGGYCAMEGEDEESDSPRAFTNAKWWKRIIILVAGSFMNLLTGFLIIMLVYSSAVAFNNAKIDSFYPNSALEEGGLQVGDTLYSVDGHRIYLASDVSMLFERVPDDRADLVVLRDGQKVCFPDFLLEKREYEDDGEKQMLYGIRLGYEDATFGRLLKQSWYGCLDFARMVWMGLGDLLTGRATMNDMGGPVTIVHIMSEQGKTAATTAAGIQNVFYVAAFIAVNLAVMNMLPIPALDGGRVFLLLVTTVLKKLLRRKIDPKYEGYIHAAGMILLLGFMAFITFHDVWMLLFKK